MGKHLPEVSIQGGIVMKRRFSILATLCAALLCCTVLLTACGGDLNPDDFTPTDYKGLKAAEGEAFRSAYTLMLDVIDTWKTDSYLRTEYFGFEARTLSAVAATQSTYTAFKVSPDYVYKQEVKVGTGMGRENDANKFYNRTGDDVYYRVVMDDDPDNVPNQGSGDEIFRVVSWADWNESTYSQSEDALEASRIRTHITTYDLSDRAYLSANHDDTVYVHGDEYLFTITLDCSDERMNSTQSEARDEFIRNTGADANGKFHMETETLLEFRVKMIDGKLRMTYYRRLESYQGARGAIKLSCRQYCKSTFDYTPSAYELDASERPNL